MFTILKNAGVRWNCRSVLVIVVFLICGSTFAQEHKNEPVLSGLYPQETLKSILISQSEWHPFPKAAERELWSSLPAEARNAHIAQGEKLLNKEWQVLPATLFLEFKRNGNRSHYEEVYFERRERLSDLVIAECMEGKGRFIDAIINGVWAICEESYWGVPAHLYIQKMGPGLPDVTEPTVDLFVGETVGLLSWTFYLLKPQLEKVSPLITSRIQQEIDRRVLIPCFERNDFHWMGFQNERVNNWNPWCNSNWLTAVLIMERDNSRRVASVSKILKSLDNFISIYPSDGGCDEGPGYWSRAGASLFDDLELLFSATKGGINVYNEPLIQEIGRYIYRVHIYGNYYINFADAPAKVNLDADLAYRYGRRINDEHLKALGAYAFSERYKKDHSVSGSIGRQLQALFNLSELLTAQGKQPLLRDVWFKELQVMAARSKEGSPEGLYVAAKGGHNAESHNHNDVGNFIVYVDGRPAIIDVGVETYTAKTFSPQRYEIWTMQSAYHNLPTIKGVMQKDGRMFAARDVTYEWDDAHAQLKLDIAGAYPSEANVKSWVRKVRLNRGKDIQIEESYELSTAKELQLSLMTPCEVKIPEPGKIALKEISAQTDNSPFQIYIYYDAKKLKASLENITIEDAHLRSTWGDRLTRIIMRSDTPPRKDTLEIRIVK